MKYLLIPIFIILFSCHNTTTEEISKNDYQILIVDGCEYVKIYRSKGNEFYGIAHKGNCKNCNKK